ncbi:uncharacterized protein YqgQ [Cytobacillus kochii]|uniref:YqgQ family protein n=1 Tax=Cytobacillus kochii TaxID=859143 RepID=UPI002785B447|nr:uncharacterized protein YqgQ [Cytobacillus kochii]
MKERIEGMNVKSFYDVQQLLKAYGAIIYMGERLLDIEMMELEVSELYKAKIIEVDTYRDALLVLRAEREKEKKKTRK